MRIWEDMKKRVRRHSLVLTEKTKSKKEKLKKENRKSTNGILSSHMDPDHPPGQRPVEGFRNSFSITGNNRDLGGDSGRNSPTTMANTAANKTIGAMKSGQAAAAPKMRTLEPYGGNYDAISPRTHTQEGDRKISEDLDLTKSGSLSAQPDLKPIDETHNGAVTPPRDAASGVGEHKNIVPAKEDDENEGFLEPTTTHLSAAQDPNFSTLSDPKQTHILPPQNPDFLRTSDLSTSNTTNTNNTTQRPGVPLEQRYTHTSSIYSDNPNELTHITTNRSDVSVPLEKTLTNESNYSTSSNVLETDKEDTNDNNDPEQQRPRPTTLQQQYMPLVDLPLTPLPSNTNFHEGDDQNATREANVDETTPTEEKDDTEVSTPIAKQGPSSRVQQPQEEEEVVDPNAPAKPGDFIAAIQNTFPTAAPNTAPNRYSPKYPHVEKSPSYKEHVQSTDGYIWTKDGHPPKKATGEDENPTSESSPAIAGTAEHAAGIDEQDATPRTKPDTDLARPNLIERDTTDLIRQTPGGFLDTPAHEIVPDIANHGA